MHLSNADQRAQHVTVKLSLLSTAKKPLLHVVNIIPI